MNDVGQAVRISSWWATAGRNIGLALNCYHCNGLICDLKYLIMYRKVCQF